MASKSSDPVSPNPKPTPSLSKAPNSSDSESDDELQTFHDASTHFSPQDEAALVSESNATKSEANSLFKAQRYSEAISTYDRALASCPNYLDYEIAVLKSNISACHLQLEDWKNVVDSATEALECLDRLHPLPVQDKKQETQNKNPQQQQQDQHGSRKPTRNNNNTQPQPSPTTNPPAIIEIPSDEDDSTFLTRLSHTSTRHADITRLRLKALHRRAKARHRQCTWASLASAQEDYQLSLQLLTSPPRDHHPPPSSSSEITAVKAALASLPDQINAAKESEMGEMMGKLKELGNGILKPFGLSTENFKMVKDETTGGYSMNFEQGAGVGRG